MEDQNKLTLEEMVALIDLVDTPNWRGNHFMIPSVECRKEGMTIKISENRNEKIKDKKPYLLTVYSNIDGAQEVDAHVLGKYEGGDQRIVKLFQSVMSYNKKREQKIVKTRLQLLKRELDLDETSPSFNLDEMLKLASFAERWHRSGDKEITKEYVAYTFFSMSITLNIPNIRIKQVDSLQSIYRISLENNDLIEKLLVPDTEFIEEYIGYYEGNDFRLARLYEYVDTTYREKYTQLLKEGLKKARKLLR